MPADCILDDHTMSQICSTIEKIIKVIPSKEVKKSLQTLYMSVIDNQSANQENANPVDNFLQLLDKSAHTMSLFLKNMDKKREKLFLTQTKDELFTHAPHVIDPKVLVAQLCTYLVLDTRQVLLFISYRHVLPLIQKISDDTDVYSRFVSVCDLITVCDTPNMEEQQLLQEQTKLEQALEELKKIVLAI